MSTLQHLQKNLQAYLLTQDANIAKFIAAPLKGTAIERLDVYNIAYRLRLIEALSVDYEALQQLLGEESFEQLSRAYLEAYPSHHFSLEVFGEHLPDFLASTPPYSHQPYLSELATFSSVLDKAVNAADAPLLSANDIMAIPQDNWSDMHITLHPSVQLTKQRWNSVAIWQAIANKQSPPPAKRLKKINYQVVWRKKIQPFYCSLQQEDVYVIQALQKHKSFGAICEGLLRWLPEEKVAGYVVNLLLRWLNDEMLSSVRVKK